MPIRRASGSAHENTPPGASQGRSAAGARGRAAGAVLLTALATLWTGLTPWTHVVGNPLGETDNHHWMFERALRGLRGEGEPWSNLPVGDAVPLMDPANLPLYLPLALVDPALGWNALALGAVLLAGLAGWALSRELGAEPDAALVGAVALAGCPFLAGVVDFGITESWGVGWFGLHATLLLAFARTGRPAHAVGAGLCLAAVALSGWYHAVFGLALEALLAPAVLWRGGWRRLPGLLGQGALAAAATAPALHAFLARRDLWQGRVAPAANPPPGWRPDWASLPIQGTDLANLVLPRLDADAPSKAAYLGLAGLLLAVLALARDPRRAALPWLLALPGLALALGPWPTVAGHPVGVSGPARWLVQALPELSMISHWNRALGAAVPFLAAATALGVARLPGGPAVRLGVAAVVLVDALALAPTSWPRPAVAASAPDSLLVLAARGEGQARRGVVQLPFDNGRVPFSDQPARTYDRWQVHHGLPRSESYEVVDALLARSDLVAGWQGATGQATTLPTEQRSRRMLPPPPPLADRRAIARELERLRGWGYRWVVLHPQRCPEPDRARAAIEAALGPPEALGVDLAWEIPGG